MTRYLTVPLNICCNADMQTRFRLLSQPVRIRRPHWICEDTILYDSISILKATDWYFRSTVCSYSFLLFATARVYGDLIPVICFKTWSRPPLTFLFFLFFLKLVQDCFYSTLNLVPKLDRFGVKSVRLATLEPASRFKRLWGKTQKTGLTGSVCADYFKFPGRVTVE